MLKNIALVTFIVCTLSRTYPKYDQCDEQWANEPLGNSPNQTICSHGSLVTSIAMDSKPSEKTTTLPL